jgi:hypothetical protein
MRTVALVAAAITLASCGGRREAASAPALQDLSGSLDAARTEFNAHVHEARFLTLLSPT